MQYKMSASFLEIYNESLCDLLSSNGSSAVSHEIKIDPERSGHVYVTNLTPVPVTSEKQACTIITYMYKARLINCFDNSVLPRPFQHSSPPHLP